MLTQVYFLFPSSGILPTGQKATKCLTLVTTIVALLVAMVLPEVNTSDVTDDESSSSSAEASNGTSSSSSSSSTSTLTWVSIHPTYPNTWVIHEGNYNDSLDPLFDSSSNFAFTDTKICAMFKFNGSFAIEYLQGQLASGSSASNVTSGINATSNNSSSSNNKTDSSYSNIGNNNNSSNNVTRKTKIALSPSTFPIGYPSTFIQEHNCDPDSNGYLYFEIPFGSTHWLVVYLRKLQANYQLMGLLFQYTTNEKEFPNHWAGSGSSLMAVYAPEKMVVPLKMSYECQSLVQFNMEASDTVVMSLNSIRFEAFTNPKKAKFSQSVHCELDSALYTDLTTIAIFLGIACVFLSCCTLAFYTALKAKLASKKATTATLVAVVNELNESHENRETGRA